ncbi:hypothetical protein [Streptomyces brevispora]|uniref:Uncharacterized protein n=1 Tax=Streptomyces brevispora TaxID=887462 RepID=A0ABZ1G5V8_9ACTN|nr:hypothetical protein [Streptomyces brevispora]WSC14886.1 hypothetical protein OIE64_19970 [Streptomyces brevispora]
MADPVTIPGYCWDENPDAAGHCVLTPRHDGNHCDWYVRESWDQPGAEWPQEQPAR